MAPMTSIFSIPTTFFPTRSSSRPPISLHLILPSRPHADTNLPLIAYASTAVDQHNALAQRSHPRTPRLAADDLQLIPPVEKGWIFHGRLNPLGRLWSGCGGGEHPGGGAVGQQCGRCLDRRAEVWGSRRREGYTVSVLIVRDGVVLKRIMFLGSSLLLRKMAENDENLLQSAWRPERGLPHKEYRTAVWHLGELRRIWGYTPQSLSTSTAGLEENDVSIWMPPSQTPC
ncbi:hypothetical protein C8R46DRAFT_241872 [Mycena filopes]|nr:hypothetical protein C8R46DRAFT_241872 [Mycena filopes]